MRKNDMVELNPEEMETVSGGFWKEIGEGIGDFGKNLWKKVKGVVQKLKNWG